jgi:hypothetical protein
MSAIQIGGRLHVVPLDAARGYAHPEVPSRSIRIETGRECKRIPNRSNAAAAAGSWQDRREYLALWPECQLTS